MQTLDATQIEDDTKFSLPELPSLYDCFSSPFPNPEGSSFMFGLAQGGSKEEYEDTDENFQTVLSAYKRQKLSQSGKKGFYKQCISCRNYFNSADLKNRYCRACQQNGVTCRDSFCQRRGKLYRYGCCLMHSMTRCVLNIKHPEHNSIDTHAAQPTIDEFNKSTRFCKVGEAEYRHKLIRFCYQMIEVHNYRLLQDLKVCLDLTIEYADGTTAEVRNRSIPGMRFENYTDTNSRFKIRIKATERAFKELVTELVVNSKQVSFVHIDGIGIMRSRHVYNVYENVLPFEAEIKVVNNKPYMSEKTGSVAYLYKPIKQRRITCAYQMPDSLRTEMMFKSHEGGYAKALLKIDAGSITAEVEGPSRGVMTSMYAFEMLENGKARTVV